MELDKNLRRLYNDFRRAYASAYQVNSRAIPTIKGAMKFSSQQLFFASVLSASAFSPISHSMIVRGVTFAAACIFCLGVAAFDRRVRRSCSDGQLQRIARSDCLSLSLLLVPFAMRCTPGTWTNLALDCSAYAGCVCSLAFGAAARFDPLLQKSRFEFRRALPAIFLASLLMYIAVIGTQATLYYNAYSTEWVDFSFGFPPIWQTPRYGFFRMINEFSAETTELRLHWPLIYIALSPITLLWKSPILVFWMQTFFFAASAYAVYLLSKHYLKNPVHCYCIATLFLAYLPVHLANLFDFHPDPLAMPFILFAFLFAARRSWPKYWLCVFATLCCIEYAGLLMAGYGIWLFSRNKKTGLSTAAISITWFMLVVLYAIPLINNGLPSIVIGQNYGDIGGSNGLVSMASFALANPSIVLAKFFRQNNIVAMVSMFLPFAFLPLRKPWILAAGVLIVVKNALSGSGMELLAHRETLFIPFIVYALILCIADITDHSLKRFYLLAVTIAVGVTFFLQGHAFPTRGFWNLRSQYIKSPHDKICDRLIAKIPDTSAVMSSSHIAPHLMARKWYFLFPRFPTPVKPEYIVVDTLEQADWDWLSRKEYMEGFGFIKRSRGYGLIEEENGIFLFKSRCFEEDYKKDVVHLPR
jgi:uncharacterized membrane protein